MRVLVLCERSGVVRRAFRDRGHAAWSCDLEPADDGSPYHYQSDALAAFDLETQTRGPIDLVLAFPPCTHLAVSGSRWFAEKRADGRQQAAIAFAKALWELPVKRLALENPVSILSSHIRKPDQTFQPWQFGHGETKRTLPVASRTPAATANQHRRGARGSRSSNAAKRRQSPASVADFRRSSASNGRAVGRAHLTQNVILIRPGDFCEEALWARHLSFS